jgi:hypothetical protein
MAAMTAPVDAADMLERVLALSGSAEVLRVQAEDAVPPELLDLLAQLTDFERELQDVLDAQETADALADAREHGTIPWADVKNQLGL